MNDNLKASIEKFTYSEENKTKLKCKDAFSIAEDLGVDLHEISRYCNRNDIRIASCQLGCFK